MKKLKRLMAMLMCSVILLGGMPFQAGATEPDDPPEDAHEGNLDKYSPEPDEVPVSISVKTIPKASAGTNMKITVYVKKTVSEGDITNIFLQPAIAGNAASLPFEIVNNSYQEKSADSDLSSYGDTAKATFNFKIKKNVTTNYYEIPFYIMYERDGSYYYVKDTVMVYAVGVKDGTKPDDMQVNFVLGEGQETPYGAYPSVMNFNINMRNAGLETAYDVRADITLSKDASVFPFEISVANYDRLLGDMKPEQTVQIPYSFAIRDKLKSGYYPLELTISYREDRDSPLVEFGKETFFVHIKGSDDEEESGEYDEKKIPKARLIVSGFETVPEQVMSGEQFKLILHMENASKDIAATNIMFTLTSTDDTFLPVTGSSSIVVDDMKPGAKVDVEMMMIAKAGLEPKTYTLTVEQKFDVEKQKDIAEKASISVPVKQVARLNTSTIEIMPNSIEVGSDTNVMFGINNTGKAILYNVTVGFVSDSIQYAEAYVGNIEPAKTGNVDIMLSGIAPTADDGKVKIQITYEDDGGEQTTVDKEMTLFVTEPMPDDFDPMGDMETMGPVENESFFGKYKSFIIPAAAVVVVAFAAAVAVAVMKKKQKKAAEEEGMDDEIS